MTGEFLHHSCLNSQFLILNSCSHDSAILDRRRTHKMYLKISVIYLAVAMISVEAILAIAVCSDDDELGLCCE